MRHRSLPARVMAYFSIGMGLYSQGSYEDVYAQLTDGLSWASRWQESYSPPSKSAIFQARVRLGSEPVAALRSARVAAPVGRPDTAGGWLAGRRLVAIDGMCVDVADSPANDEFFGRAGVSKGEKAAFPMARVVALAECGTHAIFAASVGTYKQSEAELSESLLTHLDQSMLLIADRGFFSYALWRKAVQSGADLLWRARTDRGAPTPRHVKRFCRMGRGWLICGKPTALKLVAPIRSGFGSSTTRSMTDVNTPTPTACSPPSSIPTKPARSSWPLRTGVAGRSKSPSMSSRPINVARVPCCGPNHRTWSCRRSGGTCAAISLSH